MGRDNKARSKGQQKHSEGPPPSMAMAITQPTPMARNGFVKRLTLRVVRSVSSMNLRRSTSKTSLAASSTVDVSLQRHAVVDNTNLASTARTGKTLALAPSPSPTAQDIRRASALHSVGLLPTSRRYSTIMGLGDERGTLIFGARIFKEEKPEGGEDGLSAAEVVRREWLAMAEQRSVTVSDAKEEEDGGSTGLTTSVSRSSYATDSGGGPTSTIIITSQPSPAKGTSSSSHLPPHDSSRSQSSSPSSPPPTSHSPSKSKSKSKNEDEESRVVFSFSINKPLLSPIDENDPTSTLMFGEKENPDATAALKSWTFPPSAITAIQTHGPSPTSPAPIQESKITLKDKALPPTPGTTTSQLGPASSSSNNIPSSEPNTHLSPIPSSPPTPSTPRFGLDSPRRGSVLASPTTSSSCSSSPITASDPSLSPTSPLFTTFVDTSSRTHSSSNNNAEGNSAITYVSDKLNVPGTMSVKERRATASPAHRTTHSSQRSIPKIVESPVREGFGYRLDDNDGNLTTSSPAKNVPEINDLAEKHTEGKGSGQVLPSVTISGERPTSSPSKSSNLFSRRRKSNALLPSINVPQVNEPPSTSVKDAEKTEKTNRRISSFNDFRRSVVNGLSVTRLKDSTAITNSSSSSSTVPAHLDITLQTHLAPPSTGNEPSNTLRPNAAQLMVNRQQRRPNSRLPVSPTMHNRASIFLEADKISDDESRRLSELAFLD